MSNLPAEVEFLSENENIRIVPNFNLAKLMLISGVLGPFRAGLPLQVPVWLAVNLRQKGKCRILIPDWLDINILEKVKENELETETFTKMPSEHYMTLGKVLLETCAGEIPRTDDIRTLLKDIWDIRAAKFQKSIATFLEIGSNYACVNNITPLEISSVRPFFPHALEQIYRLTENLNNAVNTGGPVQSSSSSSSSQSQNTQGASNSQNTPEDDSQNTESQGQASAVEMDIDSQN